MVGRKIEESSSIIEICYHASESSINKSNSIRTGSVGIRLESTIAKNTSVFGLARLWLLLPILPLDRKTPYLCGL